MLLYILLGNPNVHLPRDLSGTSPMWPNNEPNSESRVAGGSGDSGSGDSGSGDGGSDDGGSDDGGGETGGTHSLIKVTSACTSRCNAHFESYIQLPPEHPETLKSLTAKPRRPAPASCCK